MSEPVMIFIISTVIALNIAVLGYLIKRTITRSDEDRKDMQKEAKESHDRLVAALEAITKNNNDQHKEFYKTLETLGLRLNKIETEHKMNHPRC